MYCSLSCEVADRGLNSSSDDLHDHLSDRRTTLLSDKFVLSSWEASNVTKLVERRGLDGMAGDGHTVGRCAPSRCRCFDDGRGRVAQPLAFALTDPGGRISRTRLFPRVPASYPRLRPCASDVWNGQTEVCRQDLELRPAHAPTFMTVPSQTTQPGPTHFAVEGKRRLRPIRKDLKGRIATRWRSGLQSVESTRCKPLKWRLRRQRWRATRCGRTTRA